MESQISISKKNIAISIMGILIIGMGIIIFIEKTDNYSISEDENNILSIEKDLDDDGISNQLSFIYDCISYGNEVRCDGKINYIGENDYEISGASLGMYCYKHFSAFPDKQCTEDMDNFKIGTMDKNRNELSFQTTCNVSNTKNLKIKLGFRSGITVYPRKCDGYGI